MSICPVVAFRVQFTTNIRNPSTGYHIVFDDVKLNIGGVYNPHHGTFVAPVSGIYFLNQHFSISPGNSASLIRIAMKKMGNLFLTS